MRKARAGRRSKKNPTPAQPEIKPKVDLGDMFVKALNSNELAADEKVKKKS